MLQTDHFVVSTDKPFEFAQVLHSGQRRQAIVADVQHFEIAKWLADARVQTLNLVSRKVEELERLRKMPHFLYLVASERQFFEES